MKEIKITIIADVDDEDLDEAFRLTHHAEGIFEEYPYLQNGSVNVEVLNSLDSSGHDPYKVEQLGKMLQHEEAPDANHYGARLSHWYGDSKTLTIDAGGLRALIDHYQKNRTQM